jgi:glycine/D-amino acid oxidase-like deaminating enzyme
VTKASSFVHLRSAKFPVLPGEDDELINPGTYGKALAEYLRQRLRERSINAPFTCCEDWGWWVAVKDLPFVAGVCVYATDAVH